MKQHKKLIALVALGFATVGGWYWSSHNRVPIDVPMGIANSPAASVDDLNIQWWKLDGPRRTTYKGGANIFVPVRQTAPKKMPHCDLCGITPPPIPLVLSPYRFFGFGTVPNGSPRRAFLSDGEEVYVVAEGQTFLGRFRILKIGNATIDFEEISSGRQGRANMEDAGPTT
jgi:hypothetical protein